MDLVVIGAGSGGVRAARIAAGYGAKVTVAEDYRIGGTCVVRGCVPKKLYVYASRFKDAFDDCAGFGWRIPQAPVFEWRRLVEAKEKEVSRLSMIYRENLVRAGVRIEEQRATVDGANAVRLADGRRIETERILIATGATPSLELPVPGLEFTISSNELFDLSEFPKRLVIIGGGYIAVEFASAFARLGAEVALVVRGEKILRGFDDDLREALSEALIQAGVRLITGVLPVRFETDGEGRRAVLSNGEALGADEILIATGRRPNTRDMGLERAGVALDALGAVVVDSFSQSSTPSIYAVGDVTNRVNLTPVAIREGHAFADTVFGGKPTAVDHTSVPTAVFTTPEIGAVGLSEDEAKKIFDVVDVYAAAFRPLKATLSGRRERTLMKLVVDGRTDQVLGVHMVGEDVGELVQLAGILIRMGAKKADFDATIAVHPTAAEELVTLRTRTARHERLSAEVGPGMAAGEP
jgi:glutathione reductase (NADPH)